MLDEVFLNDNLISMNHDVHELACAAGQAAGAEQVYVFGSQARGEARADSDLDLALIIPDDLSPRLALRAAITATSERKRALDVVVIAHSTWVQGRSLLAREVRQQGVLVYGNWILRFAAGSITLRRIWIMACWVWGGIRERQLGVFSNRPRRR